MSKSDFQITVEEGSLIKYESLDPNSVIVAQGLKLILKDIQDSIEDSYSKILEVDSQPRQKYKVKGK